MRCAICLKPTPDADIVWSRGSGVCCPCYQKLVASDPRKVVLFLLPGLLMLIAFVVFIFWFLPRMGNFR